MAMVLNLLAAGAVLATVCFSFLYAFLGSGAFFSLAITFGTVAYHFCVRLLIGLLVNAVMKNKADYTKKRYQVSRAEQRFYEWIRLKKWKSRLPAYRAETFDPALHSWEEIAQATCQSEVGHEWIVLFSFLPAVASVWVGELPVFLITSSLSALLDLTFVALQRYNRPRMIRLIQKQNADKKERRGH